MNDKRVWTIGAALLAVVLLAGGYFLGVSPQLSAASAADAERSAVEAQNDALAAELEVLKSDYESIDAFKADLAALREAVPDNAELSAFVAELDALAAESGVQLTGVTIAEAKPYSGPMNAAALVQPPGPVNAAAEAVAKAAETGDPADATAAAALEEALLRTITAPVESPNVTTQNFVAIPVVLTMAGEYPKLLDFVAGLQNGSRLTLVNALSLSQALDAAPNASDDAGGPAASVVPTAGGAYTASLNANIYVLLKPGDAPVDQAAIDAAAAEAAETAAAADAE